jgi:Zn-dependent metalloprotease
MKTFMKFAAILTVLPFSFFVFPQQTLGANSYDIFRDAAIKMDKQGKVPVEIRFKEGRQISVASFFDEYKKKYKVSEDNQFKSFKVFTDQIGQTHHRFKQYYKGLELAEVQYLVHEKNGSVFYAHGRLVHGLDLDVTPALTEREALTFALRHINAKSYMWEDKKNEAFVKREQNNGDAIYYPKGELMISAGFKEKVAENFRLVYRFDIYALEPLGRYDVDVDAKTGEIVGLLPRLYNGDVQGYGTTLYNGDVQIAISDTDFYIPSFPAHFHVNNWNAYGGSGNSWWMADTNLGNYGGYADLWYEILDTNPILVPGTGYTLKFVHRYATEPPSSYLGYDGYDGMNVRISTDGGETWNVLTNPIPAYTNSSLFGFGYFYDEGPGIPGWSGSLNNWTQVSFDLDSFSGQTVQFRFAFASDGSASTAGYGDPNWFGWQIDNIFVASSADTLYLNDGFTLGITPRSLTSEVTIIPGNYRLRESGRVGGIVTFDALNQINILSAVDFVDSDSNFTDIHALAGVSVHWGTEATYDYYLTKYGRDSYDNNGGRLKSYAHYDLNLNNAYGGLGEMFFGDGDGAKYNPLVSLDFVGHEFTHSVTEFSANLNPVYESGALNESFSDIFGTAVEFYVEGSNADWFIGEDFSISIPYIRSMSNPNMRNQPDTYLGTYWWTDPGDYGGIHTNSGVQNHWFYLLSEGGSGLNDNGDYYSVTGIGVEEAAQIAYRNLTAYLMPTSEYYDARQASINSAQDLFGENSNQDKAVRNAWYAVGVGGPFGAYPLYATINNGYLVPGTDTLFLTSKISNPESHNIEVRAVIESFDQSISDTLQMFDDGLHQDSSAGDNLFGESWPLPSGERSYRVKVITFALDSSYYNVLHDEAHFTTIGPVVVDHYEIPQQTTVAFALRLYLRNDGLTDTATAVTVHVSTSDTNVTAIQHNDQNFGNIAPGQTNTSGLYPVYTQNNPDSINFSIIISSEGKDFWSDTIIVTIPTGLTENQTNVPLDYALKQNYPNPFNPTTNIEFSLKRAEFVTLRIYNILGEEVTTLISEKLVAGKYKYQWDASTFASGVYVYKLEAGGFVQTKKMLLIR